MIDFKSINQGDHIKVGRVTYRVTALDPSEPYFEAVNLAARPNKNGKRSVVTFALLLGRWNATVVVISSSTRQRTVALADLTVLA